MKAVLKKELNHFFASPIAYLVIGTYLVINGLMLWVFNGDFNILHAGFADLNSYFFLAPWLLLFLIPALTMRSFSEEINSGTIETLMTKPIHLNHLITAKFLGSFLLVLFAILPTFIYVLSIYLLGSPSGNINLGATAGSFIGLFFLVASYCAIGLFASTLSRNQIVCFILSVLLCLLFYAVFEELSAIIPSESLSSLLHYLGMKSHFSSIGKGVIDSRDLIYFLSVSCFFLYLTKLNLSNEKQL